MQNTDAAETTDTPEGDTQPDTQTTDAQDVEVQNIQVQPTAEQNAADTAVLGEVIVDANNDDVEIKESDKPYLALGADLTDA